MGELAKDIGCSEQELSKTFEDYNRYARGEAKDPFGKKYYHNFPVEINDTFHVALMEPVLHFTMGGIEIDDQARCLNGDSKQPFDGLFVCGELAGGVHGANRLGGSSLLGCVVYGRVAGDSASKYLFQQVPLPARTRPRSRPRTRSRSSRFPTRSTRSRRSPSTTR